MDGIIYSFVEKKTRIYDQIEIIASGIWWPKWENSAVCGEAAMNEYEKTFLWCDVKVWVSSNQCQ